MPPPLVEAGVVVDACSVHFPSAKCQVSLTNQMPLTNAAIRRSAAGDELEGEINLQLQRPRGHAENSSGPDGVL